jgi:monovalent cation/proton antiporter MnhG/PhaG subunit
MSVSTAISYVLLAGGVAVVLFAAIGVLSMDNVYDRLHYLAPSSLGAVLIAAAIWVREGPSIIALQATLLAAFLLLTSPALVHGTARAARISEHGDWRTRRGEAVEPEGR